MKKFLTILTLAFLFNACTVHLVPQKSQTLITMDSTAAANTNALYDHIIASSDKSYDIYANEYANINSEIEQIISVQFLNLY